MKNFTMNTKLIRSLACTAALLIGGTVLLSAAEPTKEEAAFSSRLLTSLEKSDYAMFSVDWDAALKPKLKKEPFTMTSALYAARLQAGYEVSYLGDLNQSGTHVTLWKVSFKDRSDDALVTLVTKEGKVAGFWIK
jgi:hypothetical protein